MNDNRAWRWGVVSGCAAGLLEAALAMRASPVSIWLRGHGLHLTHGVLVVGALLPPGMVSAVARRFYWAWGLLPAVVVNLWVLGAFAFFAPPGTAGVWTRHMINNDLPSLLLVSLAGWLVSSSIVSVMRWRLQRGMPQDGNPPAPASHAEQDVWPPPPNNKT